MIREILIDKVADFLQEVTGNDIETDGNGDFYAIVNAIEDFTKE